MAKLSDAIEEFIKALLKESVESELQIQRNELANYFSCAPSQINYVLTTRFTCDKGYYIESRRGGGGYIVIKRLEHSEEMPLYQEIIDQIGESVTYDKGINIINGLMESGIITEREGRLMKIAINDRILSNYENRNKVRAYMLKSMVMVIIS